MTTPFNLENRDAYAQLIASTGEDLNREGLLATPERAAKAFAFLTQGYHQNLEEITNNAIFPTDNNELIIDAYNANPSSMKVALDNFITMPVQPKAIILGDMRELGPTSDELHAEVVEQIKKGQFDKVFLCGEHFSKVGKEFSPFATTEAMTEELRRQPLKGYHILIKGSHSMGLEKLADIL